MVEVGGARNFAGTGDAYDRFTGRYSQLLAPAFADFCGIEYGHRLLDVGCGPGAFTAVATDRLGEDCVVGVDPSPSFVASCRERHPGVDVRVGAAEELPFADDAFDRAVAQLVMHFASDAPRAAREMCRVVRPGGVVAASVWDSGDGMGLLRVLRDARRAVEGASSEPDVPLVRRPWPARRAAVRRRAGRARGGDADRDGPATPGSTTSGAGCSRASGLPAPTSRPCPPPTATTTGRRCTPRSARPPVTSCSRPRPGPPAVSCRADRAAHRV